jgi:outer membrane protein with beta-barrel domain
VLKIHVYKAALLVSFIAFAALPACAQDSHHGEAYVGFSYAHIRLDSEAALFAPTSRNFYGVQAGFKLNVHKNIGIMLLDVGVQWGGTKVPSPLGSQFNTNTRLATTQALFGPEFTFRSSRVDVFGRTLVGVNHTDLVLQFTNTTADLVGRTYFALGAGGGLDIKLKHDLALRIGADYIPTRVNGNWENDFRNCIGIVFRFW